MPPPDATAPAQAVRPSPGLGGAAIVALLLAAAQAPLGSTLIAVALPSIGGAMGEDVGLLTSLLVTSYLVVNVVAQGPGGRVSDLLGHGRTLWVGIALYAAGACAGLAAQGVALLVASRCAMALAGALVVPATLALLRLHMPVERRGRALGLFGATMGLSAALGPAMGGEIVSLAGWRGVFAASLPFLAAASVMLKLSPPPRAAAAAAPRGPAAGFDYAGVALLALAIGPLVVLPRLGGVAAAVAAALVVAAGIPFVVRALRTAQPVIDLRLLAVPAFAAGAGMMALQNFAMYGLLFQLPQFFERFRATPPREVGYVLFVMMIGMVAAAPAGGRLCDRFGQRRAGLLGAGVLLGGSLLLCRLPSFAGPGDALLSLLVFGLGMGLCSAPTQSATLSAAPAGQAGMAAGLASTMRYLGGIASMLALGAVLGGAAAESEPRHQLMTVLFAAAVLLSLVAAPALGRLRVVTKP